MASMFFYKGATMRLSEKREHLPIWGDVIPGNTGKSKYDVMTVDKTMDPIEALMQYPGIWDKSTPELGDLRGNDYMVWNEEIRDGYAQNTFSDVPLLIPYLVEGSDRCVILCPGGAYLTKSVESEGEEVAAFLNEAGISAFVLWYRSHPYRAPYMYLDCQRAIRYVRYHAADFGIDPQKIAVAGFSAGGNLCGVEALCFRNAPVEAEGYIPDAVDAVDGNPNALGLIYPAVTFSDDKIVAVVAGPDIYNDREKRDAFAARYDLRTHVREGDAPAFLCACMDDMVVAPGRLLELAAVYHEKGVPCEVHLFPYGGHGFGACEEHPVPDYIPVPPADYTACRQWRELFVHWLRHVFA